MATGQTRRRQQSRRTTDQGKAVEVAQYFFYTTEAATRFAAAQEGLAATRHPQLCPFLACRTTRSELLSVVTVEIEATDVTVASETQSRRKAGAYWTVKEVFRLLKDITAALVHLSATVSSSQDLCCVDVSGESVAFVDRTFQLKSWGRREFVDFGRLDPASFSPEMKGNYVQWLSGQRALAEVDYGKAAVYSLGLLAVTMLSPELCDSFLPCDQLEETVQSLSSSSLLQQILQEMLTSDPALRPSPSDLAQILASRLRPDPSQQLASLSRAMAAADYATIHRELEGLWDAGVVGRVEYPCSACGAGIELGRGKKVIDVCEKHLFCNVGCLVNLASNYQLPTDNQCPVCLRNVQPAPPKRRLIIKKPPLVRKTCSTCQQPFDLRTSDAWRLDYQGDVQTEDFCSVQCLSSAPLPELTPQLCSDLEFLNSLEGINCYMRRLEWALPILDQEAPANEPMADMAVRGVQSDLSFAQTLLIRHNPLFQCHFCGCAIENLATGRWTQCGLELTFVCSCDCFRNSLGIYPGQTALKDVVCKACGGCIVTRDIEVALGTGRRKCAICMRNFAPERPPCGHQVCNQCRGDQGGCLACSLFLGTQQGRLRRR